MADGIDFLVFSGHKVYAPGSPGVIVGERALLSQVEPDEVGGGMVDDVSFEDYAVTEHFPEREEAGTPNIVGAVLLGAALEALMQVGMEAVQAHEQALLARLLGALLARPGVRVYGDTDLARSPRVGTVAFNLEGLDHALVAAVLNDYFCVAVRNACFCGDPYVREMLKPELWEADANLDLEGEERTCGDRAAQRHGAREASGSTPFRKTSTRYWRASTPCSPIRTDFARATSRWRTACTANRSFFRAGTDAVNPGDELRRRILAASHQLS